MSIKYSIYQLVTGNVTMHSSDIVLRKILGDHNSFEQAETALNNYIVQGDNSNYTILPIYHYRHVE